MDLRQWFDDARDAAVKRYAEDVPVLVLVAVSFDDRGQPKTVEFDTNLDVRTPEGLDDLFRTLVLGAQYVSAGEPEEIAITEFDLNSTAGS